MIDFSLFGLAGTAVVLAGYLPQIFKLLRHKDATGISLAAWFIWLLAGVMLLLHAIYIEDLIFIVVELTSATAITLIIMLALIYNKNDKSKLIKQKS